MKRLLVLVDKIGRKKELLAKYLAKNLSKETRVVLAKFSDLIFNVEGKKVEVFLEGTEYQIQDFDLVYFRRAGREYAVSAGSLAVVLNHLGIKFFDTTFGNIGPLGSKFTSYLRLSLAGFPTIPSFFCFQSKITDNVETIIEKFCLPLVVKELDTQRGEGVFLIKKRKDFDELPLKSKEGREHEFMFQKFVESRGEYRILVLKDKIGAYERKVRTNPNEFRSNVALGAREEFIDVKKIPEPMKRMAIKAAQVLDVQISGVDVLVDKQDKVWLLEVNRGPGLTYDFQISPELESLASFFEQELKKI